MFVSWESRPAVVDGPRAWAVLDKARIWTEVDCATVIAGGTVMSPQDFIAHFGDLALPSTYDTYLAADPIGPH